MTHDPGKVLSASLLTLMAAGALLTAFSSPARAYLTHGLLQPALYHGDEITAKSGERWWGLYQRGDAFELRTTTLTISDIHDPIVDLEGETTGKRVTVDTDAQPLFLVHGLPRPVEGPVRTVFHGYRYLHPGEMEPLSLGPSKNYHLGALADVREEGRLLVLRGYTLKLYQNLWSEDPTAQVLARLDILDVDGRPALLWAGDLDRDGGLDLLMDLTGHYNVSVLTLFLSSAAQNGELTGLAAQLVTTGC